MQDSSSLELTDAPVFQSCLRRMAVDFPSRTTIYVHSGRTHHIQRTDECATVTPSLLMYTSVQTAAELNRSPRFYLLGGSGRIHPRWGL